MNNFCLSVIVILVQGSFILLMPAWVNAQQRTFVSNAWVSDIGSDSYKNPIINADYSDPDACRVGDAFYMVASSFNAIPGLPILQSKDLVNWSLIGHGLKRQPPFEHYEKTQHGNGVWAPAIRYHKSEFYIYYPDPDFGIYVIKSKTAAGPWSDPVLVEGGKGLIDPCPLWDGDGNVYLVHAYAGSRAGIKSILVIKKMNVEGTKTLDAGVIVYDGHEKDPTVEGPKLYKRNNYYYIFAPAGGVATGWQLVLRAKTIYGPYERKVVMDQGTTDINGPHQGAWITTGEGEDWFIHFQDKGVYGRVVHLQPMRWRNDWPVIGIDKNEDGKGEPVLKYKKPFVGKDHAVNTPADSDEFDASSEGLQWQWQANPQASWSFRTNEGSLRLYSVEIPDNSVNLWMVPNLLLQKLPAEEFTASTKVVFKPNPKLEGEKAGLVIMGQSYAYLALKGMEGGMGLIYSTCKDAAKEKPETEKVITTVQDSVYLRVNVSKGGKCIFSYSLDGKKFSEIEDVFQAEAGRWIGAKVGIFCTRTERTNDSGFADFDWFRIEK